MKLFRNTVYFLTFAAAPFALGYCIAELAIIISNSL
jgi:hypothetical protein